MNMSQSSPTGEALARHNPSDATARSGARQLDPVLLLSTSHEGAMARLGHALRESVRVGRLGLKLIAEGRELEIPGRLVSTAAR